MYKTRKEAKWYMGTIASTVAGTTTHPLDLIKVNLQTAGAKKGIFRIIRDIIKEEGCCSFYRGVTATIINQITYSSTRFIIYNYLRKKVNHQEKMWHNIWMSSLAGAAAGFVGTPTDVVTVRMQNDLKVPEEQRRNYKNVIHGLILIWREEGFVSLFNGLTGAIGRGIVMTIGQLAVYDQTKYLLLLTDLEDTFLTHFLGSCVAAVAATCLSIPVDVIKTRMMNAPAGQYKNLLHCILKTAKEGYHAFGKGVLPAVVRVVINTIIILVLYEQLRLHFGTDINVGTTTATATTANATTANATTANATIATTIVF